MSYGAAVAVSAVVSGPQRLTHKTPQIWLWASATADIALSIALYVNLRSRIAGFNMKTDHAIQSLINVALKTASYTAVVALAGAITSVGIPFDSCASKLFLACGERTGADRSLLQFSSQTYAKNTSSTK